MRQKGRFSSKNCGLHSPAANVTYEIPFTFTVKKNRRGAPLRRSEEEWGRGVGVATPAAHLDGMEPEAPGPARRTFIHQLQISVAKEKLKKVIGTGQDNKQ